MHFFIPFSTFFSHRMGALACPIFLALLCLLPACRDPAELPPPLPPDPLVSLRDGITRIGDDSLAFVLFAPGKQSVHLIGDFNQWTVSDAYRMHPVGDRFRLTIGLPDRNKSYVCQYLIDDTLRIADPYAHRLSDPNDRDIPASIDPQPIPYPTGRTTGIAMVVTTQADDYTWKIPHYSPPDPSRLVVYEILIRDFTEQGSIRGAQARLPYLKDLGVNAVELMPFNEFEGNDSWGYNPSFYFAVDKAYGTDADYKAFIDACHANGMAVIMDLVLNHSYGQSPLVRMYQRPDGAPSADNPWYNVASPNPHYAWGYDFNHESPHTQAFVDSVCAYWLAEYHIDGYRFDFTKGFTNTPGDGQAFDRTRIDLLKRMADEIWKRKPEALLLFEHLAGNDEEKELAEYGILLWGNLNYAMNEATMGWGEEPAGASTKGDLSWGSYRQRGWTHPHLLTYMESHDEERLMYKNRQWGRTTPDYDVRSLPTGLRRAAAAAVILFALPGPKMLWQFGELGYDYPLGASMEDGRLDKKPVRWDYLDDPDRQALHDVYAQMIDFHTRHPLFAASDYVMALADNFKYIVLHDSGRTAVAMANFDVVPRSQSIPFGRAGTWTDCFSGHTLTTTGLTATLTLRPGEYRLYF